jgi:putative endonuclease
MPLHSNPEEWADARHRQGAEGEEIAQEFLKREGWAVLAHRFRMGRLEIDIIARKDNLVAFVEVKTRFSTQFGIPAQAVTWHKQREIARVAQAWIDRFGRAAYTYRFDVIGVLRPRTLEQRVEHIADAFRVTRR